MADGAEQNFYDIYPEFRAYDPPNMKPKHVRQFDYEFWAPSGCTPAAAVLEIGSGTGMFLAYLVHKGVARYFGLDTDEEVLKVLPDHIKENFAVRDVWQFLDETIGKEKFDHIVLFDVFEHFTSQEGVQLLKKFREILNPGGRVTMRMPNMESPWGLQYQFGDLTHRAAYTSGSIKQSALAARYKVITTLPQRRRRGLRRWKEALLEAFLNFMLHEPPRIWSANFIAVLEMQDDG